MSSPTTGLCSTRLAFGTSSPKSGFMSSTAQTSLGSPREVDEGTARACIARGLDGCELNRVYRFQLHARRAGTTETVDAPPAERHAAPGCTSGTSALARIVNSPFLTRCVR